jgi:hypothetical protein
MEHEYIYICHKRFATEAEFLVSNFRLFFVERVRFLTRVFVAGVVVNTVLLLSECRCVGKIIPFQHFMFKHNTKNKTAAEPIPIILHD